MMVGLIAMTGVAAAVLFPAAKRLDPVVEAFAGYPGEHWRIVAGQPANQLFLICDMASLGLLAVAAITLALRLWIKPRFRSSASAAMRIAAIVALVFATGYGAFVLDARMNSTAHAFWAAAEEGRIAEADALRDAFAQDHPKSTVALTVRLSCALVAFGAGLFHALAPQPSAPAKASPA